MALGERSNEFVVREGSIKSARFVQGRKRREAERVWKKSLENSLSWGGKMGAPLGSRLMGRKGGAMPLQVAQVRCDNKGPESAADERARKPRTAVGEGRHRTKPLVTEMCLGGTDCAADMLTQVAETSLILRRSRAAKAP